MTKSVFIIGLLLTQLSYGQIKKGALLLGPTFSYGQNKITNTSASDPDYISTSRTMSFNGTLRVGYFVNDKTAVGILGGFGGNKTTTDARNSNIVMNTSSSKMELSSAGLFARRYRMFKESKFGIFGELKALYVTGNFKTSSKAQQIGSLLVTNETKSDVTGMDAALSPGIVYFMTGKIGLEASFGSLSFTNRTNQYYYNGEKTNKTQDSNLNVVFNTLSLGMIFYISK